MSISTAKTPSPGAVIATGTAVIAVTYGLIRFGYGLYLPAFRAEFDLSTGTAGAIAAGSFAGYCVAAVLAERLIARGRPRLALWASGGLAVLGALLVAAAWSAASLTAGVVIGGSAAGAASPALVAAIGATVAPALLDRAQAVVNSGTSAGIVVGGLAALAVPERWRVTWVVFAVTAALVSVAVDRRASWAAETSGPNPAQGAGARWGALLPVLLSAMLVGAGSAAVWTFGPDQLTDVGGLSGTATALLWCLLGGAGALGALSGDLVSRMGLRWTWALGATVTAMSTLLLGVAPDVLPLAALALIGFGGAYVALSGVLIVWAARLHPQRAAQVTAAFFLALTAGQAIGSVALGLLTSRSSSTTSFTVAACLALASTAAAASSPTAAAVPGHR